MKLFITFNSLLSEDGSISDSVASKLHNFSKKNEVVYLSCLEIIEEVRLEAKVIIKYGLPYGKVVFRVDGETYEQLFLRINPEVFVGSEEIYQGLSEEIRNKVLLKRFEEL